MDDSIVIRRIEERFELVKTPERAKISLAMIRSASDRALTLDRDKIHLGYPRSEQVTYRIIGWDPDQIALILEKED